MTENNQGRRPIARAFRIQEVLASSATPLGVSALSRRADLPKSTVSRIIANLADAGMAERVGARYVAGPRLLSLADRITADGTADLRRWLLPYLVQLHDLTGLAVAFATLHYGRVHYSDVFYGRSTADKLANLPLWAPAHCTAAGKVLLAYSRSSGPAWRLAAQADFTQVDPAEFSQELWRIRREGVAYHNGEYVTGISGMAVGLFNRNGAVVGAVALCGPADAFEVAEARTALRHVAGTASSELRRRGLSPTSDA